MARTSFDPPAAASPTGDPGGHARHIGVVLHDFSTGGTERVAIRLADAWAAAGRRVTIFCGSEEGPTRGLVGGHVRVVPVAPRMRRGVADRATLGEAIAGMVLGMRPDVVVGPGNYHAAVLHAMLRRLGRRRPAVVCKISNPLHRPDRSGLAQAAFAWRFRRVTAGFDRLVAMSPALAHEAGRVLGGRALVSVAEPSIDDDRALPLARAATGTVVCLGRLTAQKRTGLAIAAFARSRHARRLTILGEGPEEADLRALAAALGVAERVTFAGFVPDPTPHLRGADALLVGSRFEGYPAAMVEALAAGLPVVTTPCSAALPEILSDPSFGMVAATGLEAEAGPATLADALDAVLAAGTRPARAPLRALLLRHRRSASAAAWLAVLDEAAAARAARWTPAPVPAASLLGATAARRTG